MAKRISKTDPAISDEALLYPDLMESSNSATDSPFGRSTRMKILSGYFDNAGEVSDENAWEHVYRCLLWMNEGARLAHIYDSNHMQKAGGFHLTHLIHPAEGSCGRGVPLRYSTIRDHAPPLLA